MNFISKTFYKLSSFFNYLGVFFSNPHPFPDDLKSWYDVNGDLTYRLNYNHLSRNSIIFDLGGYQGEWASSIYSMYESFIYIFEPIPQYAEFIEQRFVNNKKIKVFCCGLARQDSMGKLSLEENASSSIRKKNIPEVSIQYRNFVLFLAENKIQKIDLIKINIEGDEYELLEHLIEIDFLKNINDLQIQFHSFVPKSKIRMLNIQKKLSESHKLTYQFPFIWENWTKKI